jgi:hypothetical protein
VYCHNSRLDNILLCIPVNTHTGVLVLFFDVQYYITAGPLSKTPYVNTLAGVFSGRASKGLSSKIPQEWNVLWNVLARKFHNHTRHQYK